MNVDAALQVVATVTAALGGLCVGSFVNVLIYRLPRGRSVVVPRSHCFHCGTELTARDLVPVLSLWCSSGRCRYCGVAVDGQYGWVEASCGLLYAGLVYRGGVTLTTGAALVATAAMIAALVIDLRYKIIPSELNAAIFFAGLAAALGGALARAMAVDVGPTLTLGQALAGTVVGYVVFEAIVRVGRWLFGQEAMGGGDVLLAAAVGALLGPGRRFGAFFLIAILAGALTGVTLLATGRLSRREPMAFGPFLVIGALVVLLVPESADVIAAWYGFGR